MFSVLHVYRYQGDRTPTWMNFIKTVTVFGELVGSVSVKIASGLLSSVEEKVNVLLIDQILSLAFLYYIGY